MSWGFDLSTDVEIGGSKYEIRSDYRAILDICTALNDPELSGQDKGGVLLGIFYKDPELIPTDRYDEAVQACFRFINGGKDEPPNRRDPKLIDWEKDFSFIVAPINRVTGKEIRSLPYLHWWTFLSAYYEIGGDCLFAQIIRIRNALARGKTLDKSDREWYRKNRDLVDIKAKYTEAEERAEAEWLT